MGRVRLLQTGIRKLLLVILTAAALAAAAGAGAVVGWYLMSAATAAPRADQAATPAPRLNYVDVAHQWAVVYLPFPVLEVSGRRELGFEIVEVHMILPRANILTFTMTFKSDATESDVKAALIDASIKLSQ